MNVVFKLVCGSELTSSIGLQFQENQKIISSTSGVGVQCSAVQESAEQWSNGCFGCLGSLGCLGCLMPQAPETKVVLGCK